MHLFYEKGFHETSVRDIAHACGLTPGALYNHFRSKDDILYSIMRWSHDELDRDLAEALDASESTPSARLRAAVRAFVLRHTKYREAARVANREYAALTQDRREEIIIRRRRIRTLFQRLIGDVTGATRTRTAPDGLIGMSEDEITAMAVINLMIMVAEWYREGGSLSSEAVADHHATLVLRLASDHHSE